MSHYAARDDLREMAEHYETIAALDTLRHGVKLANARRIAGWQLAAGRR